MIRNYLTLLLLFLLAFPVCAQEDSVRHKWQYSVGPAASLAFSGVNVNITGEARRGRQAIYLGPKISVADSYLPSKGPFGINAGYKLFFRRHDSPGRFNFFIVVDYWTQRYKAYRATTDLPKKYNTLHEINAGYGLQYNINNRLAINNVLGFGRYLEVFNNTKSGTKTNFDGFNRLVKVQLLYRIR